MRILQAGEFGLISKIAALVKEKSDAASPAWQGLLLGIGDDAAAWKCAEGTELMTTDIMAEGVHFDFNYTNWQDLGWKSMAINISDINSMGGHPRYALVSLALPGRREVEDVLRLYDGMLEISNRYGIALAGGNISASETVMINIALIGLASGDVLTRSSAVPGDLIAVCGWPGLSAAGYKVLNEYIPVDPAAARLFRDAHLRPSADFTTGSRLALSGVRAAIDISDGLIADLAHICEASRVSADIDIEKVPLHAVLKQYFPHDCLKMALAGGEDYELLFTAPPEVMHHVLDTIVPAPAIIGEVSARDDHSVKLLDKAGRAVQMEPSGWDHYKRTA